MSDPLPLALLAALLLAAVHVLGGRFHVSLDRIPRNWLLSAGSGVSVAYVFVHLLPEVAALEERLGDEVLGWIVALAGLVLFYGLELLGRRRDGGTTGWAHLASYALYNALLGYLLLERAHLGAVELWTFTGAMVLHLLVNDHGLRQRHAELYRRVGRWLVGGGVLAGTLVSALVAPSPTALELLLAFVAGAVVMNVLKEELPEDRQSRWLPFVVATVAYGALLLVL